MSEMKMCGTRSGSGCGQELPASEFYKRDRSLYKDGLLNLCKTCVIATSKKNWSRRWDEAIASGKMECVCCRQTLAIEFFTCGGGSMCGRCWRDKGLRRRYRVLDDSTGQVRPMTINDQESMFEALGRRCAVCGFDDPRSSRGWAVDHCHDTNLVRGITCQSCNVILGHAKDDPARLRVAADYLEHHAARFDVPACMQPLYRPGRQIVETWSSAPR
ncbi:MAG: endonuclease VII domain-containing protein [Acidimicrobiales bacterium]